MVVLEIAAFSTKQILMVKPLLVHVVPGMAGMDLNAVRFAKKVKRGLMVGVSS
jgi:hypothetical protein